MTCTECEQPFMPIAKEGKGVCPKCFGEYIDEYEPTRAEMKSWCNECSAQLKPDEIKDGVCYDCLEAAIGDEPDSIYDANDGTEGSN